MNTICPLCSTTCQSSEYGASSPLHHAACRRCGVNLVIVTKPLKAEGEGADGNGREAVSFFPVGNATASRAQPEQAGQILCQRCRAPHVFQVEKLRQPLARGTCRKCATPFIFVNRPDPVQPPAATAPIVSDSHTSTVPDRDAAHSLDPGARSHRLSFHGTGAALFGMHIVNILLIVVTLGIYRFWAKTKIRHYLWSQCEFEGDRFVYHGTGKELCAGWARAFVVFGLPIIGLGLMRDVLDVGAALKVTAALLIPAISTAFLPVAIVGARRYRLSRTSWRGIAFSFRGHAMDFVKLFLKGWCLTGLTLGLYYPLFDTKRHGFLLAHSYFGQQRFSFDGQGRDLFKSYLAMLALFPFTLGLAWIWYVVRKQTYFWDHTAFATARFHYTATWPQLLGLKLVNGLLLVFTLGLAWPWVTVRTMIFTFRHLTWEGVVDLDAIQQAAQPATATGEGIASFFDFLDAGFDLG